MTKTMTQTKRVAGKAVNRMKTAPQKLMEHTVGTALQTVEKAAIKQAVRTEKKTQKKIAKAVKKAERAAIKKPGKAAVARRTAKKIKEQIRNIIRPEKEEIFYYDRRQVFLLTVVYAAVSYLVYLLAHCLAEKNMLNNMWLSSLMFATVILAAAALAAAVMVLLFPPKLAVVTAKQITIDHNAPLLWHDVRLAEEKLSSCLFRRPFIALHLREGATYSLTFMQKLCQHNIFTPFSLPLYAMKTEDAEKLRHLVKKHTQYQNSIKK